MNAQEIKRSIPAPALLENSIMKLNFLSHAIQNVWGDKECLYSEEVIMGGCMLMRDITGELAEILQRQSKEAFDNKRH